MLEGSCDIVQAHIVLVKTTNVKYSKKKGNIGLMANLNVVAVSSRELFQDTLLEIVIVILLMTMMRGRKKHVKRFTHGWVKDLAFDSSIHKCKEGPLKGFSCTF